MAAASVAQVHRGRLLDQREVVVKVRRPGIVPQIRSDIRLLRRVLRLAAWAWPALSRQHPVTLVDELSAQLDVEIDFRHEARNMRRLGEALVKAPQAATDTDAVAVWMPGVIEPFVAEDVLVQACSPVRPLEASFGTAEGALLASVLFDAYLHQSSWLARFTRTRTLGTCSSCPMAGFAFTTSGRSARSTAALDMHWRNCWKL